MLDFHLTRNRLACFDDVNLCCAVDVAAHRDNKPHAVKYIEAHLHDVAECFTT